MADNIGLLLKLILDKVSKNETQKGLSDVADTVKKTSATISELTAKEKELTAAIEAQQKKVDAAKNGMEAYASRVENIQKRLKKEPSNPYLSQDLKVATENQKKYADALGEEEARLQSLQSELAAAKEQHLEVAEAVKKENKEVEQLAKFAGVSTREFKKLSAEQQNAARNALEVQKNIDKLNKEMQETERRVGDLNQLASSIGQLSSGMFIAGSAIVGSLYATANAEAQRVKEAGGVVDETTQKWLTAQERIKVAYQRVGRVAGTAILPILEKAAALAEKGSKFVEQHPDLVKAALNVGAVAATVGAVGMLVAKGVRFFADVTLIGAQIKYAASTAIFKSSVDKFMGGVAKQGLGSVGTGGIARKAGSVLGAVTLVATSVIIGAEVGKLLGNTIAKAIYGEGYKNQGLGDAARTAYRAASLPGQAIALQLKELGVISEETAAKIANFVSGTDQLIGKVVDGEDALAGLTDGLDEMAASAERAKAEAEGMKVLSDLNHDNIEAEREYQRERSNITKRANQALSQENENFKRTMQSIKDNLGGTLANLAKDFAQSNQQAETEYRTEYANTVRDGQEEILQIRKDSQEELRKLEEDFALQQDDLTRARDALGLVKAQREFERQKKEIEKGQAEEVAESRRQTKVRLAEMRVSFEQERAERIAKYQQDVIDAKAKAVIEQEQAKLAHDDRLKEISRQRSEELSELQRSYNEERRRRILAAQEQIKDLGNSLSAERILRQRYYQVFADDAKAILDSIRRSNAVGGGNGSITGSGSGNVRGGGMPSRQLGGPIDATGAYFLHKGEHVLSPGVNSALSALIGAQVSQRALLNAVAGGSSFNLTDSRRIEYSIPAAERRALQDEFVGKAMDMFGQLIGGRR